MTHTLSALVKKTGAKRRAVQVWADSGVLEAVPNTDRAGTGVNREYGDIELKVAALLAPLADLALPIGRLKQASSYFRTIVKAAEEVSETQWDRVPKVTDSHGINTFRAVWRASRGIGQNFFFLMRLPDAIEVHSETDEHGPIQMTHSFFTDPSSVQPAPAVIMLNLTAILKGLTD